MKKIFAWALSAILIASSVQAQVIPSIPYNLTNGSLADATQVMGNFNTIVSDVNANSATNGANNNITSLTGLTTPLAPQYGGTVIYTGGTTGGAANVQTLSTTVPSNFALTNGNIVTATAGFTNSGAMTLNVGGVGNTAVQKNMTAGPVALTGGEIIAGNPYVFEVVGSVLIVLNPVINGPAISSALDALGSAQGDIIYRDSVVWSALPPGTKGNILKTNGTAANPSWGNFVVKTQVFTSNGTYTPTTGMQYCIGKVYGGGAGGGGGISGGGGGAGGYAEGVMTAATIGVSQAVTIGGGGAAGTSGGGTGGGGGTSSIGSLLTASGGIGGNGNAATNGTSGGIGGTGGGSALQFQIPGAPGGSGGSVSGFNAGGAGGGNGGGNGGANVGPGAGVSGVANSGGGGGGGVVSNAGGAGGSGLVVITEYIIN